MTKKLAVSLVFVVPLLVLSFLERVGLSARPETYATQMQVTLQGHDQDPPPSDAPFDACPGNYNFEDLKWITLNQHTYYFWLLLGTRDQYYGSGTIGLAQYNFGDVISTSRTALLKSVWKKVTCNRVFDPDGSSTVYMYETDNGAGSLIILYGADTTAAPSGGGGQPGGGGTYTEYCLFVNYYDDNWVYQYSEIIPGSCWWEET